MGIQRIQRRGVQDLTTAIFIVESIVELQMSGKEKSNPSKGKDGGNGDHEKVDRPKHYKGNKEGDEKFKQPKKSGDKLYIQCFLCDRLHRARECSRRSKIFTTIEEEDMGCKEVAQGSLQLAVVMKKKYPSKEVRKGQLFINAKLGNCDVRTLIDMGALNNFMKLE